MEKSKPKQPGVTPRGGDQPTKIELQKKPLLLNQGCRSFLAVILCSKLSNEGRLLVLGLGNGKILSYDPATKLVLQLAKCKTALTQAL